MLTVICCHIYLKLEASRKVDFFEHEAREIYSLTTDRLPVIYSAKSTYKEGSVLILSQKNDDKASVPFKCRQFFDVT